MVWPTGSDPLRPHSRARRRDGRKKNFWYGSYRGDGRKLEVSWLCRTDVARGRPPEPGSMARARHTAPRSGSAGSVARTATVAAQRPRAVGNGA
eukprot:scaffold9120_cov151-Isochrysis_galbana.AAC.1